MENGLVSLKGNPFSSSFIANINFSDYAPSDQWVVPLTFTQNGQETVLGYGVCVPVYDRAADGEGHISLIKDLQQFLSYDLEALRTAAAAVEVPAPTREDVIQYYLGSSYEGDNNLFEKYSCGSAEARVINRFDTEEYTFLYLTQETPRGANELLVRVQSDGTWYNYAQDFEPVSFWGTKHFDNVTIHQDTQTVTFTYDKTYSINLRTGEMTDGASIS